MAWNPNHPSVFVEPSPQGQPISLVRHDSYPYQEDWDEQATGWDGLFAIANRYLTLVNTRLHLPQAWIDDLHGDMPPGPRPPALLRWLPNLDDPRHSYWAERHRGLDAPERPERGTVLDRAAVLVAGLFDPEPLQPLYGGQGLRVIIQAGPPHETPAPVRIRGVFSTLPAPQTATVHLGLISALADLISEAFGLPENVTVVDIGVRLQPEPKSPIVFAKTAPPAHPHDGYSYQDFSYALVMLAHQKEKGVLEPIARYPLIAFTNADADQYVQDPISKTGASEFTNLRPNRSWLVLDPERVNVLLGDLPDSATAGYVKLVDPDPNNQPNFQVLNCRLVDPPAYDSYPKEVPMSVDEHVRTNTFAAVNAFYHTSQLFERMRVYGLPLVDYFKFVERPLAVRYRSGISPGFGDGRTVNAQVLWIMKPDGGLMGTIEVRFALGDLESAVGRLPANKPSPEKSPLGVASDPRWCWHEFCHVLLAAVAGDLELGFAHSAGDALAAILSDPDSELAKDESGLLANNGPWRGVTFPWVLIPRRHDRSVYDGWSWTGPMNSPQLYFAAERGLSDKRGYWVEQILSSSLFRLYRAIGGDSERTQGGLQLPAKLERKAAADYTAFLIMYAFQLLGPVAVVPATTASDFMETIKAADHTPLTNPGPGGYVGGTINKVIQWAFERQGLYATPVPDSVVSGPHELARVDLHIEDLRPKRDGVYSPVDLLGTAWHARPASLQVKNAFWPPWTRKKRIFVKVENRGPLDANDTEVEVWWVRVPASGVISAFPDSTKWRSLGILTGDVAGATGYGTSPGTTGYRPFGPFLWDPPAPGNYAILATATCPADMSNVDPNSKLPCASTAGPVNILVACDNNLGLVIVTIP